MSGMTEVALYLFPALMIASGSIHLLTARARKQERLAMANSLRERTAYLSATLDVMREGVVACDREGVVTEINATIRNVLGWNQLPPGLRIGNLIAGRFHPEDMRRVEHGELPLVRAISGEKVEGMEMIVARPGISENTRFRVNACPVMDPGTDRIIGAVATFTDVTRERELTDQLLQSQKMESLGRLAGGIAHDFNNKLCVLRLALEQLRAKAEGPGECEEELGVLEQAITKCSDLTRKILVFGRRQVLQPKVFHANEALRSNMAMLKRLLEENISFELHCEAQLDRIRIDPILLDQVILNLVVNARDAMPGGGLITIETFNRTVRPGERLAPGDYLGVSVTDTGIGIPPEIQGKIFEPFFSTKPSGNGLGLSTVHGIAKQSGGDVWVDSEVGKGTVFKIYFPITSAPVDAVRKKPKGGAISEGLRVLLVEDDPAILDLVRRDLSGRGAEVLVARDGATALALASGESPLDLVLTDTVLPGLIDGEHLATTLQSRQPGLRVLYMSGYTENVLIRDGVLKPGIALISKPFHPDDLTEKITEVLAKPAAG